jgi:hypothetical protein
MKNRRGFESVEIILVIAIVGVLAALLIPAFMNDSMSSADKKQAEATKIALAEADRQIGMPDITRYTERKLAKDILELRDKEIATYCYIVSLNGDLIYLGEAIGYGLPYSVQFTNPERILKYDEYPGSGSGGTIPQADPNGLFMPDGLSATWVMLKGPDGKVKPVYIEPQIIVSPFKLTGVKQ